MPEDIPVRVRSRSPIRAWGYSTILMPKWFRIPMKDPAAPYDPKFEARTRYRLSIPIAEAGDFLTVVEGELQEISTVVKSGNKSDVTFRSALGWASRGIAEQPANIANDAGDERAESVAAIRLLQSGGVEVLDVEGMVKAKKDPKNGLAKRLIRSPADIFTIQELPTMTVAWQSGRIVGPRQGICWIIGTRHLIWRCSFSPDVVF